MTLNLTVVSAGLSNPSSTRLLADRLSEAVQDAVNGVSITTVELRDIAQNSLSTMLSGFPVGGAKTALEAVQRADGLVLVTPLFNGTFSGLFKSFMDIIPSDALTGKPVLLGATGGTPRHSLAIDFALRPLMAYYKADVMPTAVFAATDDWSDVDEVNPLPLRIKKAGKELAMMMSVNSGEGLTDGVQHRPNQYVTAPVDEFANVPDFETMLSELAR